MYTTLAVTTLLTTLTSAFIIPQVQQIQLIPTALSPASNHPAVTDGLSNRCTFTLFHKQLCLPTSPTRKTNYIQLNEIIDHPNDITIDIAGLRKASARNSYVKLGKYEAYAVEGLLDGRSLVIREGARDEVTFDYDSARWTSDRRRESEDGYCDAGKWDNEDWECGMGSRERRLHCAFTCDKIDPEDLEEAKAEDVKWMSELR